MPKRTSKAERERRAGEHERCVRAWRYLDAMESAAERPWLNDPDWIAARDRAESEDRADMLAGRNAYAPNA